MSGASIINIGELAKPATVLIEKISDAIGTIYEPSRIRNEAQAKADAALTEAKSRIQIGDLERRALSRFVEEQSKDQANIESITSQALPNISQDSDPSKMDEDWIRHFFEKCKRVSNQEMQHIWARLLENEANQPNSVSKRTVDFVASMDKSDAETFTKICQFSANSLGEVLIFDCSDPIVQSNGLTWSDLTHLDNIGLIKFQNLTGFVRKELSETLQLVIGSDVLNVKLKLKGGTRSLTTGKVILTKIGEELRRFVEFDAIDQYIDYCIKYWVKDASVTLSSPFPRLSIDPKSLRYAWGIRTK